MAGQHSNPYSNVTKDQVTNVREASEVKNNLPKESKPSRDAYAVHAQIRVNPIEYFNTLGKSDSRTISKVIESGILGPKADQALKSLYRLAKQRERVDHMVKTGNIPAFATSDGKATGQKGAELTQEEARLMREAEDTFAKDAEEELRKLLSGGKRKGEE